LAVPDRNPKIDHDLETTPLEIKTDSILGSEDTMRVDFYDSNKTQAGGFVLLLTSPPQYYVWLCSGSYKTLQTHLPAATDKIWRLTLTRTSGIRLIIHCNEEEVLNFLISDSTCIEKNWSAYWNRKVTKIWFDLDTASDFYRPTGKMNKNKNFSKFLSLNMIYKSTARSQRYLYFVFM
jgi:hypothetical protein